MQNYYQLLGIPNFSSFEEVAEAYKKKHAEMFSSESPLENIPKLKELKDALDLLANDEKREEYDEELSDYLEEIHAKFDEAVDDIKNNKLQEAANKLIWCISKDPKEPDYYEAMGLVCRLANDCEKAIKYYKQGLKTGQKAPYFHREMAEVYALMHDDDNREAHLLDAAEGFKEILKTDPKNVAAIEGLAALYGKIQFYEEAIELYERLIKSFPYNADYHRDLGGIYYEADMYEEAESHLLEALRLAPGSHSSLLYLGLVYFKRRLLGLAAQTLQDCLKANPNQPEVKQLIEQIELIRAEIGQTVEEIIYDPAPDSYVEGTVKWYNPESGMGVLTCKTCPEVLLHYTALNEKDISSLKKGDAVRFGIVKDKSSPIAVQVEKISETEASDLTPGVIERFDMNKKIGAIKAYDGSEVFFAFSALSEEVLKELKTNLPVLFEAKSTAGLSDNALEQAIRVRLRKPKKTPAKPK